MLVNSLVSFRKIIDTVNLIKFHKREPVTHVDRKKFLKIAQNVSQILLERINLSNL